MNHSSRNAHALLLVEIRFLFDEGNALNAYIFVIYVVTILSIPSPPIPGIILIEITEMVLNMWSRLHGHLRPINKGAFTLRKLS